MANYKYKAFISYSHADEREGEWLQRALERFRAPSALVGKATAAGEIARRLTPVFRDRDDLPAAGNLNAEIQAALAGSQFQIVLCSPNAAKSRWVNEEVKLFKKLNGPDRTLAIIVAGEPGASALPGREAEECFPPALRFALDAAGEMTDEPAEPIAADARKEGDGKRFALLKLAAGMMGVKLDDLVQRDVQRRARLAWTWTGASTALAAGAGLLAAYAIQQGHEAERSRDEAEGLIAFMIGELRDKIEPLGRTDVLAAVGEKALAYYATQNRGSLNDAALAKRARALALIAEMDLRRGALETALDAFREAARTSTLLLSRRPNDEQLIFDHAQSVFYIGDIASRRDDLKTAEMQMLEYLRLAERLVALNPANPDWRLEMAYATGNLGSMKFRAGDFAEAVPFYEKSAQARLELFNATPQDQKKALAYAYALSWIAFAELRLGDFDRAASELEKQLAVYEPMLARDPDNFNVMDPLVTAQRRLADARFCLGDLPASRKALAAAQGTAKRLRERDPTNANWTMNAVYVDKASAAFAGLDGDKDAEASALDRAVALSKAVLEKESSHRDAAAALASALALRLAADGDPIVLAKVAADLATALSDAYAINSDSGPAAVGEASVSLAAYYDKLGKTAEAKQLRLTAIAFLSKQRSKMSVLAKWSLARLYFHEGDLAKTKEMATELDAMGFRDPAFVEFRDRLKGAPQR